MYCRKNVNDSEDWLNVIIDREQYERNTRNQ